MSRTRKALEAAITITNTRSIAEALKLCEEAIELGDWISVDDSLPQDCESVLVYCRVGGARLVGSAFHYKGDFYIGRNCVDVTHWQPLPRPPKETQ